MALASGELARLAGISPDTLRHYERVGVLAKPARSANNYRRYPESALGRVRLVRRALAFGFSLSELATLLGERDRGGQPCRKVRALAARKLESTERRLAELIRLRDDLKALLADWDQKLEAAPPGRLAHLLETLPPPPATFTTLESADHEPNRPPSRRPHSLPGGWGHESRRGRAPTPGQRQR